MEKILKWDIYEISSEEESLHKVKFRGRIRKFSLLNNINLLVENVSKKDGENKVRFAVLNKEDAEKIKKFVFEIFPKLEIKLVLENVENPVLSRLQINNSERYFI